MRVQIIAVVRPLQFPFELSRDITENSPSRSRSQGTEVTIVTGAFSAKRSRITARMCHVTGS